MITVDPPYQIPDGDWVCLVWRDIKAFPCGGKSSETAIAIAGMMERALRLYQSDDVALGEVAREVIDLKLE